MKLFDFRKRQPPQVKPPEAPSPREDGREVEDILNDTWSFPPSKVTESGNLMFTGDDIESITAIASARALMSIAEDLAAIRKHLTRLQLVKEPESSEPMAVYEASE